MVMAMQNEKLDRGKIQSVNGVDFEYVDDQTTFSPTWRTVQSPESPGSMTILEKLLVRMKPVEKPKKVRTEIASRLVFSKTLDSNVDVVGMIEPRDIFIAIGLALKIDPGSMEFAGREYAKGKTFETVLLIQEV
jgi:hypothetical protein